MPFNLAPTVQNRAGELMGAGISGAGQSIADAITQAKAKHDELKGYQQILKAAAADPANGIDPDSIDKMSLADAKGTIASLEIRRATAQAKQQQAAQGGLAAMLSAMTTNRQPVSAPPAAGLPGTSPAVNDARFGAPGMSLQDAILNAAQKNPAALQTDTGSRLLTTALTQGMRAPQGNPQVDPSGRFYMSDTGWKPLPRQDAPGNGAPGAARGRTNPGDSIEPDVDLVPYTPPGSKAPIPGLYEKTKDGKRVGFWQDPQSPTRAADGGTGMMKNGMPSFQEIQESAGEEKANSTPSIESSGDMPTVTTQDEFDALGSGAQYIGKDGQTYQKP